MQIGQGLGSGTALLLRSFQSTVCMQLVEEFEDRVVDDVHAIKGEVTEEVEGIKGEMASVRSDVAQALQAVSDLLDKAARASASPAATPRPSASAVTPRAPTSPEETEMALTGLKVADARVDTLQQGFDNACAATHVRTEASPLWRHATCWDAAAKGASCAGDESTVRRH